MKTLSAIIVGIAALSLVQTQAQLDIPLVNYDFEEPGTGKISDDWGLIPGWNSDSTPTDSGVETGWTTSGEYSGYLRSSDDSIWQTTGYAIQQGDDFALTFLGRNNWSGGALGDLKVSLYYDDGGTRVAFGSAFVVLDQAAEAPEEIAMSFTAPGAAAGMNVGVEFDNTTAGEGSWMLVDRVQLVNMAVIPEPSTMALVGLGALGLIALRRRA